MLSAFLLPVALFLPPQANAWQPPASRAATRPTTRSADPERGVVIGPGGVVKEVPNYTGPEPTLKVGDPAPAFVPGVWLKGEPVTTFARERCYVIEFWATWCGPCRMAMPELSALARRYRGKVTFVGVDIMEALHQRDPKADWLPRVRAFVDALGDGMDYAVAADTPAGTLARDWMTAAGRQGIPCTFLIADGRIAWIGHPGGLAEQLTARVDGRATSQPAVTRADRLQYLADYKALAQAGDYAGALRFVDATATDPRWLYLRSTNQIRRYHLLTHLAPEQARTYGETLLAERGNAPLALYELAQACLGTLDIMGMAAPKAKQPDPELAQRALRAALARTSPYDTGLRAQLAAAWFQAGDVATAVTVQQEVVDALTRDPAGPPVSDDQLAEARARLQSWRAAR